MRSFLLIFFVFTLNMFSQQTGVWQNYTSMFIVNDAAKTSEGIWAATEGGCFYYDFNSKTFLQLYKTDGLNSLQLTSLEIDNSGKIWLGSREGYINIYDPRDGSVGRLLEIYNSDKSQKQINDFFVDGENLFTAMDFGASLINTQKIIFSESFLKFGSFPVETKVNEIKKDGIVYASLNTGVAVQKSGASNLSSPDSWNSFPFSSDNLRANSTAMFNGELLAGTNEGIYKQTSNGWEKYLLNEEVVSLDVLNGKLNILLKKSLISYNGSEAITIIEPGNLVFNEIYYLNENSFVIATNSGALNYENGDSELIAPNGPATNSIFDLTVDNEGVVWVGTGTDVTGRGVYSYNGNNWTIYNTANTEAFLSNAFNSVYAAPDGVKYFTNWGKGFTRLAGGNFTTFFRDGTGLIGIPADTNFVVITDVRVDSKNNVWVLNHSSANDEPLSVLTPESSWYHFQLTANLRQRELLASRSLVIDPYGTKWFNTDPLSERSGIIYFNENGTLENSSDDVWGNLDKGDGLNSEIVNDMAD